MKPSLAFATLSLATAFLGLLPAPATALPNPVTVTPVGFFFVPAVVTVPAGTTIVWDSLVPIIPHTITTSDGVLDAFAARANDLSDANGDGGDDGDPDTFDHALAPLSDFSHTFNAPGTFVYFCKVHVLEKMTGVVQVV